MLRARIRAVVGAGIKGRLLRPQDELTDRWLGIRTFGWRPHVSNEHDPHWQVEYVPCPYAVLRRVMQRVEIGPGDVFVDLGSGMGRAVFAASWHGAGRAVGVEIDPILASAARHNLSHSRLRGRPIEFVESRAESYPQDDTTVLFLFNPFGAGTLASVAHEVE